MTNTEKQMYIMRRKANKLDIYSFERHHQYFSCTLLFKRQHYSCWTVSHTSDILLSPTACLQSPIKHKYPPQVWTIFLSCYQNVFAWINLDITIQHVFCQAIHSCKIWCLWIIILIHTWQSMSLLDCMRWYIATCYNTFSIPLDTAGWWYIICLALNVDSMSET